MANGLFETLSKIGKYDVFETILGLFFLFGGGYLYINYFFNFEGREVLSLMIIGLLMVGLAFFGDGSYKWRNRYEKEEDFEDKKRELELDIKSGKLQGRKKFINDCRREISERYWHASSFRETSLYSNLKNYLGDKLQKDVEKKRYTPGKLLSLKKKAKIAMEEAEIKKKLFAELNMLEKKWGLL